MSRRQSTVLVVLLVALSGAGVAGAGAAVPAGDSGVRQPTGPPQQVAACDYASLYNRTIDSVVAVRTSAGLGSGFAVRVDESTGTSYLVTNAHVVSDARSVVVQFSRDGVRIGRVVGTDAFTDLAVVRVNRTPSYVDALDVADATPRPGERVAALGTPFGLAGTITHGIVSGVDRSVPTTFGTTLPNVVQTDAPINPGNSGGPLVSCDGRVVGVNTAGIQAGRAENVGFAVSAPVVAQVVPELLSDGEYDHAYLGIQTRPLMPPLVVANGFDTGGVYVHGVTADGPASEALQASDGTTTVNGTQVPVGGDLVVAVDGQRVRSHEDLASYLLVETRPGDVVTLTVIRDGERRNVTATLGERPDTGSS